MVMRGCGYLRGIVPPSEPPCLSPSYALTAGAFGIGTTEFVIMGLLLAGRRRSHVSDRRPPAC